MLRRWNSVLGTRLTSYLQSEDGVVTIEAVLWIPIFAFLIWFVTETAMIFGGMTTVMRVEQDANRLYASGYFQTAADTENFIRAQLPTWSSQITVATSEVNKIIHTTISVPVTVMTGVDAIAAFSGISVTVSSEQMAEG